MHIFVELPVQEWCVGTIPEEYVEYKMLFNIAKIIAIKPYACDVRSDKTTIMSENGDCSTVMLTYKEVCEKICLYEYSTVLPYVRG